MRFDLDLYQSNWLSEIGVKSTSLKKRIELNCSRIYSKKGLLAQRSGEGVVRVSAHFGLQYSGLDSAAECNTILAKDGNCQSSISFISLSKVFIISIPYWHVEILFCRISSNFCKIYEHPMESCLNVILNFLLEFPQQFNQLAYLLAVCLG